MTRKLKKEKDGERFLIIDENTGRKLFRMDTEFREDYDDSYSLYDMKQKKNVFGTTNRGDAMGLLRHLESGGNVENSGIKSWRR
jgi:hypothetical protein